VQWFDDVSDSCGQCLVRRPQTGGNSRRQLWQPVSRPDVKNLSRQRFVLSEVHLVTDSQSFLPKIGA
jgi:hypothetical protein